MVIEVTQIELGPRCLTDFQGGSDTLADVMSAGVEIEVALAVLLGTLGSTDPYLSAIVLRQMKSVADQEKAVLAVAKVALDPANYDLVAIAIKAIEAHRTRRNAFAHHVWGRSSDIPGAIFLLRTSEYTRRVVRLLNPGYDTDARIIFHVEPRDLYRSAQLQEAREEASAARAVMQRLVAYMIVTRVNGVAETSEEAKALERFRFNPVHTQLRQRSLRLLVA